MEPQQDQEYTLDVQVEKTITPQKKSAISIPAAILTGAVIIAVAIVIAFAPRNGSTKEQAGTPQKNTTPTSIPADIAKLRDGDYIRGNKNADVIVIEYSDSDCPYCARFHPVMEQVVEEYDGDVAWVYRHFPLTQLHPNAYTEALALECVGELGGNQKFQNYLDTIIDVTLTPDPKSNTALIKYAEDEGISETALKACIEGDTASARIDASINEASQIGAQGTPFSVAVNQKTGKQAVIAGAYPIEQVRKLIDSIR